MRTRAKEWNTCTQVPKTVGRVRGSREDEIQTYYRLRRGSPPIWLYGGVPACDSSSQSQSLIPNHLIGCKCFSWSKIRGHHTIFGNNKRLRHLASLAGFYRHCTHCHDRALFVNASTIDKSDICMRHISVVNGSRINFVCSSSSKADPYCSRM